MDANDAFQIHLQNYHRKMKKRLKQFIRWVTDTLVFVLLIHCRNSSHFNGQPGMFVNGFYDLTELSWRKLFGLCPRFANNLSIAHSRFIIFEVDGIRSDETPYDVKLVDKNLDMRTGVLMEIFDVKSPTNKQFRLTCNLSPPHADKHLFVIKYGVSALNFTGALTVIKQHPYIVR